MIVERHKDDRDWPKGDAGFVANPPKRYGYCDFGSDQWALSAFSNTTGFPSVVEIHDGRLCMGNTATEPTTIHFSEIGGFDTTSSTWITVDDDGQVYDDLGFNVSIGGGNQSPIQWISSSSDGVLVGSYNSEGVIGANDTSNGFVPGGVSYRKSTSVGSRSIQPVMIDQSTLFVSRSGRRVHEMTYDLSTTGQKSPDLTALAEHVSKTGIIDIAFQREPRDTVWMVLSDGKLIALTFDKNNEIEAWHQHDLGGDGVRVRSVATIPSITGLEDEVWLSVDRTTIFADTPILLEVKRSVEILSDIFNDSQTILESRHLDSFVEFSTDTRTGELDSATNRIDTDATHGYSEDDIIFLSGVKYKDSDLYAQDGVTDEEINNDTSADQLNNQYFKVAAPVGGNYFGLKSLSGGAISITDIIDSSNTGSTLRECIAQETKTSFGNVPSMGGETVTAYIDGRDGVSQYIEDYDISTVGATSSEAGTGYYANMVLGYTYKSYVELINIEPPGNSSTAQGKIKKINKVMVRILNSLGLKFGDSATNIEEYDFDEQASLSDYRDLKSGDYVLDWIGDFEQSGTIRLQGDGPYPLQIQSIVADVDTKGFSSNR